MSARATKRACALALAAAAAACGYTQGSGMDRLGVRTVALDVVGNDTFRQRLEVDLSQALARELPVSTDVMLADRRTADATLQVLLTDDDEYTLVVGARGAGQRPRAQDRAGARERLLSRLACGAERRSDPAQDLLPRLGCSRSRRRVRDRF